MSRIAACFSALKQNKKGAFISYIEAGDPDYATTLTILKEMPEAGADIIEVGMPFSDPMADGPVIQQAAQRSLAGGATMKQTLNLVADFRKTNNSTPIVLMGYLNPIENYGVERFCEDAAKAGVDGLVIVDLPPEEIDLLEKPAKDNAIDIIRLITPTTSPERLAYIASGASGFLYYVSITGITGTRTASSEELAEAFNRIRSATTLPVVVGFGLSTRTHVENALKVADGAVVASALIHTLAQSLDEQKQATPETISSVINHLKALTGHQS